MRYPIAPESEWYGDANYRQTGAKLVHMTPAAYLKRVRPLRMDETARDNIDDLKWHIKNGNTLDPLAIYPNGIEDGRHRAYAAQELGIRSVPVLVWPKNAMRDPLPTKPLPHGKHDWAALSARAKAEGKKIVIDSRGVHFVVKRDPPRLAHTPSGVSAARYTRPLVTFPCDFLVNMHGPHGAVFVPTTQKAKRYIKKSGPLRADHMKWVAGAVHTGHKSRIRGFVVEHAHMKELAALLQRTGFEVHFA